MKYLRLFVITFGLASLFVVGHSAAAATLNPTSDSYRLKDSAMIEHNGTWHVFSIYDCRPGMSCDASQIGIRHFVSTDLATWMDAGTVITPRGTGWESNAVWAPTIVEHDGLYTMFYTGVHTQNGLPVQSIGYATSTDLFTWNRPANNQVLTCGSFSWVYWNVNDASSSGVNCRDPYVTWDNNSQQWVMTFATNVAQTNQEWPWVTNPMVVGLATSSDLLHWSDAGMIPTTRWWKVESPHLYTHNNQAYISWTDNCSRGSCLQYGTGPTMLGSLARVDNWPGMPTNDYASEVLEHNGHDYVLSVHGFGLNFEEILWNGTVPQAGNIQAATINGWTWLDNNANGQPESDEASVSNIFTTAYRDNGDGVFNPLSDQVYNRAATNTQGLYQLNQLLPGTYWLSIDYSLLAGAGRGGLASTPTVVGPINVGGAMSMDVDFPLHPVGRQWILAPSYTNVTGNLTVGQGVVNGTDGVAQPIVNESLPFQKLVQFNVGVAGPNDAWHLQISNDGGQTWLWWNNGWTTSDQSFVQGNDLTTLNNHLTDFPTGGGQFLWRIVVEDNDVTLMYVGLQLDDHPGMPSIQSPSNNQAVNSLEPSLNATISDPDGNPLVAEIQIDTNPNFTSASKRLFSSLSDCAGWTPPCNALLGGMISYIPQTALPNGQVYWRLRSIDLQGAGLWSDWSTAQSFITPAALSASTPVVTITSTSSIRIDWSSNNPATSEAYYNGDDNGEFADGQSVLNHTAVFTGLTPGVTYALDVAMHDIYGQVIQVSAGLITMPLAPTIMSDVIITPGVQTATVAWTTNYAVNSWIEYGLTSSYGQTVTISDLLTNHNQTVNNLVAGQVYHFRVHSGGVLPAVSGDLQAYIQPPFYAPVAPIQNDLPVLKKPGPFGQNSRVSRRNVRMRAKHRADLTVEIPAEINFLAGRFSVDINDNGVCLWLVFPPLLNGNKRANYSFKVHAKFTNKVYHHDRFLANPKGFLTNTRCSSRQVHRPD